MSLNLVTDPWIVYLYKDDSSKLGTLAEMVNPDIVDIICPRADFYGASFQFFIGIVQTVAAPEDFAEWEDLYYEALSIEEFQRKLALISHAFEVFGDGARFMQDLDPLNDIQEKNYTPISGLLIEAPGENTIKQNTDHFIKRGLADELSTAMAALALFTLQINAPAGGQGHRTGIRGGGPLTTLIKPSEDNCSLWQKVWLNVRNRENWDYSEPDFHDGSIFPWLAPTRISKKENSKIYPSDVHPLHMLWAMPRRIRLVLCDEEGICSLSGEKTDSVVRFYKTQNYGNNYAGSWYHPLTHYRTDPKKPQEDAYSTKAQPGGITYQHWLALLFSGRDALGSHPAAVIQDYREQNIEIFNTPARVWAFGFDMDNMKARGWYSVEMPMLYSDKEVHDQQIEVIEHMLDLSVETLKYCRGLIKAALTDRPKDLKGDLSFIDANFYQATEKPFFAIIAKTTKESNNKIYTLSEQSAKEWRRCVEDAARNLFDAYVISGMDYGQPKNMERIVKQRKLLQEWLQGAKNKPLKVFKQHYISSKESAK